MNHESKRTILIASIGTSPGGADERRLGARLACKILQLRASIG